MPNWCCVIVMVVAWQWVGCICFSLESSAGLVCVSIFVSPTSCRNDPPRFVEPNESIQLNGFSAEHRFVWCARQSGQQIVCRSNFVWPPPPRVGFRFASPPPAAPSSGAPTRRLPTWAEPAPPLRHTAFGQDDAKLARNRPRPQTTGSSRLRPASALARRRPRPTIQELRSRASRLLAWVAHQQSSGKILLYWSRAKITAN